jgi:hypothetical protein
MSFLDLTNVDTGRKTFEPLPAGQYLCTGVDAEVKDTKAGTGKYISLQMKVMQGEHEGRVLFATFNIHSQSEKAQQIGREQLKGFMQAAGFTDFNLQSVKDLCGKPVVAVVKIEENPDFGAQNRVSYFKDAPKNAVAPF